MASLPSITPGEPIYVTVMAFQRDEIVAYCFGKCGAVLMAILTDETFGALSPCRQEVCPYLDTQLPEPMGELNGSPVYVRKLKTIQAMIPVSPEEFSELSEESLKQISEIVAFIGVPKEVEDDKV